MAEASDFGPLVQLAEEFIKEYSFELLDPLGNRHGSWEVTFHRSPAESPESNGYLDRFVSLAFTSLPAAVSSRGLYEVEVWAGADNGDQFTRHLTSEFHISEDHLKTPETLNSILATRLERAVEVSNQLEANDLDEAYLPSRGSLATGAGG